MQHTKQLNTRDIRPNWRMKKYQTAISYSSNKNQMREQNEIQDPLKG